MPLWQSCYTAAAATFLKSSVWNLDVQYGLTASVVILDYGYHEEAAWQEAVVPKKQWCHQRLHNHNKEFKNLSSSMQKYGHLL